MSLFGDMNAKDKQQDVIWKALADVTRREILDALAERPLTTGELVERFDHLCRTNVMKHVEVLVKARLIVIRREGRRRWNYLNPAPIQAVCDRWVSKHVRHLAGAMSRLKEHVEDRIRNAPGDSLSAQRKQAKPNSTKHQKGSTR